MIFIEMAVAVLTVVFAVLPAYGVFHRNAFVGVRTRATMRDESAWRRGHHAAILPTSLAAAAVVLIGVAATVLGRSNDVAVVVLCSVVLVAGALWSAAAARRTLR